METLNVALNNGSKRQDEDMTMNGEWKKDMTTLNVELKNKQLL